MTSPDCARPAGERAGRKMTRVIIALGANLGDRGGNLEHALEDIRVPGVTVARVSRFIENPPAENTAGGNFLNGAALLETDRPAPEILGVLLAAEAKAGRPRHRRPGLARPLDLDIVYFGDLVLDTPDLVIPHPRRLGRRFVMGPAAEIAPDFRDPVMGKTLARLWAELFAAT